MWYCYNMEREFYLEYTDQFGKTDEISVHTELNANPVWDTVYTAQGSKDYRIGDMYTLEDIISIEPNDLQLMVDDNLAILDLILEKVEALNTL